MEDREQQERTWKMTTALPYQLNLDDRGAANILSTIHKIQSSGSDESMLEKQAAITDSDSVSNDDDKQEQRQVRPTAKKVRRNRKIKHIIARHLLLLRTKHHQQQQRLLRLQEQQRVAAFRRAAAMAIAKNIGGKTWEHAQLAANKHQLTRRAKKK
jgi:hypothetical protein